MITNVSMTNFKPAFGLARLSPEGANAARAFGYPSNDFLNGDLFCKQKGLAKKTPLAQAIASGVTLQQLAQDYGCSDNPTANADFIENCILSKKGQKALKNVPLEEKAAAMMMLWDKNYDNPELSVKSTKALLELIKDCVEPHIYVQNKGLLGDAK